MHDCLNIKLPYPFSLDYSKHLIIFKKITLAYFTKKKKTVVLFKISLRCNKFFLHKIHNKSNLTKKNRDKSLCELPVEEKFWVELYFICK